MIIIGITGGIGSGKSVVSRILRLQGLEVYDCDSRAKSLMNSSQHIKKRIHDEISPEVTDGISTPDRRLLAEIVFSNEKMRLRLNDIVHEAVRRDLNSHVNNCKKEFLFVEAAVLAESGLAGICTSIWLVKSALKERIRRVVDRDGIDRKSVEERIKSQFIEEKMLSQYEKKIQVIENYKENSLLSQIQKLISIISNYS